MIYHMTGDGKIYKSSRGGVGWTKPQMIRGQFEGSNYLPVLRYPFDQVYKNESYKGLG